MFSYFWVKQTEYLGWLEKAEDKFSARCKVCAITLTYRTWESGIDNHAKGAKHRGLVGEKREAAGLKIHDFFAGTSSKEKSSTSSKASLPKNSQESSSVSTESKPSNSSLTSFLTKNDVLRAEVLWTLKVVKSHYSFKLTDI